jgi:hypothetical protein
MTGARDRRNPERQTRVLTGMTGTSSVDPQLWQRATTVWRRTGKVCTPQR